MLTHGLPTMDTPETRALRKKRLSHGARLESTREQLRSLIVQYHDARYVAEQETLRTRISAVKSDLADLATQGQTLRADEHAALTPSAEVVAAWQEAYTAQALVYQEARRVAETEYVQLVAIVQEATRLQIPLTAVARVPEEAPL